METGAIRNFQSKDSICLIKAVANMTKEVAMMASINRNFNSVKLFTRIHWGTASMNS